MEKWTFDIQQDMWLPPQIFEERLMRHIWRDMEKGVKEMKQLEILKMSLLEAKIKKEKEKQIFVNKETGATYTIREKVNEDGRIVKVMEVTDILPEGFEEINNMLEEQRQKRAALVRKEKEEKRLQEEREKEEKRLQEEREKEETKKESDKQYREAENKNWRREELELQRIENLRKMNQLKLENKEILAPDGEILNPIENPASFESRRCWNCLSVGHKYTECNISLRRFCRGCGKWKVTLRECPDCRQGWSEGLRPTAHNYRDNTHYRK